MGIDMAKSFAVIGIGRFGTSVAVTLCAMGHEVLAVDVDQTLVNAIADKVTHAVAADTTDERALRRMGVDSFDAVVVSTGENIRVSILTTMLLKELGAKRVIAKASDELHAKLLEKTGADQIVLPERDSGVRLARALVLDSVLDYLELTDDVSINEIRIPKPWVGKSLIEVNVRRVYGVSVVAIRRGETMVVTIDPTAPLLGEDVLVVLGHNAALQKIAELGA